MLSSIKIRMQNVYLKILHRKLCFAALGDIMLLSAGFISTNHSILLWVGGRWVVMFQQLKNRKAANSQQSRLQTNTSAVRLHYKHRNQSVCVARTIKNIDSPLCNQSTLFNLEIILKPPPPIIANCN